MRALALVSVSLFLGAARASAVGPPARPYTTWEHGRDCALEIGVEVPRFNCLNGALIPAKRDGRDIPYGESGPCDKSAHGSSGCTPGSRLLKYVDTITRNGRQERIATTIICRGGGQRVGDPIFDDIAIIQHNETNNKVCWFNVLGGRNSTDVPPPYTASGNERASRTAAESYWGRHTTTLNCTSCHESGLYIRTPWIMQVQGSRDGAFTRAGGSGPYAAGGTNGFPSNGIAGRRGFACTVGRAHMAEWNERLRPGAANQIRLVKINSEAFDAMWASERKPRGEGQLPASTCTRCHFLGSGGNGTICEMAKASLRGQGVSPINQLSEHAQRFPNSHWMPPADASEWDNHELPAADASRKMIRASRRGWQRKLSAASRAVDFCCEPANYDREFNGQKLCQGTFAGYPNPQAPCDPPAAAPRTARGDGGGLLPHSATLGR